MNSQEIKGRPHSVAALLFEAYGIDAEITPRNIALARANINFGAEFREQFDALTNASNSEINNFGGFEMIGADIGNAVQAAKAKKTKRAFNLDAVLSTTEKLSNTAGRVIGNIKGKTFTEERRESERVLGINSTLFLVIAALGCFLFIISLKKS